ncbi:MAG: hypothetical protein JNK63_04285 [Chthonomonas sp.]|nr:hypothetical protein [Chthonomonas sp.]
MSVIGKALIFIAVGCGLLCLTAVFFSVNKIQEGVAAMRPIAGCMLEANALRDSILHYANRHDGKLPGAETWADDVRAEFLRRRSELIALDLQLRDKSATPAIRWSADRGPWGCVIDGQMQAFQYNADLAGKELKSIKDPMKTVLVFETPALQNAAVKYERRGDRTKPEVLGQLRDWIVVPVSGKMQDLVGTGQGSPASR